MDATKRSSLLLGRPWGVRVLAWVLFALCLVGRVSDLAHFFVVEHTVCAEHGELIHGSDHRHDARASSPDILSISVETGAHREVTWAPSGAADHDHEHCAALSDRRDQLMLSAVASHGALPEWRLALPVANPVSAGAAQAIPLLLLAPKNSPPLGA